MDVDYVQEIQLKSFGSAQERKERKLHSFAG